MATSHRKKRLVRVAMAARSLPPGLQVHRASEHGRGGLKQLNFFVASVQAGFGPFIAVFLTRQGWTQGDIGFALSVDTFAAMASQLPAGALVDRLRSKRLAAMIALLAIGASALALALWPVRAPVLASEALHGFASCMLGPAIAALTLAVYGHAGLGESFGQNARFASIGNAVAASVMGVFGTYVSSRAVLLLTAALTVPALLALARLGPAEHAPVDPETSHAAMLPPHERRKRPHRSWHVFADRRLLAFAACAALFFLGSAAMLPLAAGEMTKQIGSSAALLIAALIVVPQFVVAGFSPAIGRFAEHWGRLPVLLVGFVALPVRGLLFAGVTSPYLLIPIQALDGVSGAVFGVMVPLVAADLSRKGGHLNLSMAVISLGIGLGATFSTALAGMIGDHWGNRVAFLGLAGAGAVAALMLWLVMPETRPEPTAESSAMLPA